MDISISRSYMSQGTWDPKQDLLEDLWTWEHPVRENNQITLYKQNQNDLRCKVCAW